MEITVEPGKRRGKHKARKAAISGAMTIYGAAAAKDTLLDALDGAAELEVDLSGVAEMDTAGVQLLALLTREAASSGKRLVLRGHSPAVMEVLDCYRLAAHLGDATATIEGKR
jgi:anti-anti-sigma factor